MVMLAGRAETPRSARLPRPMAAEAVVQALALPQRLSEVLAAVSVRRVGRLPQQALMALAAAPPAALLLESVL